MKLIVGLGNPGFQYKDTRHNIGFLILDSLNLGIFTFQKKFEGELFQHSKDLIFLKPQTFMNLSGNSVSRIASFYKIDPKDILVIHDEIDFEFGRLGYKFGGGTAGHNGLKSIVEKLGTNDFARLRIGVGKPENKQDIASYVLEKFTAQEKELLLEKKFGDIKSFIDDFISKE